MDRNHPVVLPPGSLLRKSEAIPNEEADPPGGWEGFSQTLCCGLSSPGAGLALGCMTVKAISTQNAPIIVYLGYLAAPPPGPAAASSGPGCPRRTAASPRPEHRNICSGEFVLTPTRIWTKTPQNCAERNPRLPGPALAAAAQSPTGVVVPRPPGTACGCRQKTTSPSKHRAALCPLAAAPAAGSVMHHGTCSLAAGAAAGAAAGGDSISRQAARRGRGAGQGRHGGRQGCAGAGPVRPAGHRREGVGEGGQTGVPLSPRPGRLRRRLPLRPGQEAAGPRLRVCCSPDAELSDRFSRCGCLCPCRGKAPPALTRTRVVRAWSGYCRFP